MSGAKPFRIAYANSLIANLKFSGDNFDTDYIAPECALGLVGVTVRDSEGTVHTHDTEGFGPQDNPYRLVGLKVQSQFEEDGEALIWRIELSNEGRQELEVEDLSIPFPMHSSFDWKKEITESVFRHSIISLDGSFMFWMRPNSVGPYLVLTPQKGTSLEFYDNAFDKNAGVVLRAYIHSKGAGKIAKDKGCNWRLPYSSLTLRPGETQTYAFKLQWADDYMAVRDLLYQEGLFDVEIVPGMTIPAGTSVKMRIRTKQKIEAIEAEYPSLTQIGHMKGDMWLATFKRLGENKLTVVCESGARTVLEFFITEPIQTLIDKRSAFLKKCQHTDHSKWYHGLISDWNMESKTLLGPDNYDKIKGWRIYAVTCDDPGLGKPAFLAAKNAVRPKQDEIDALDLYIDHFVWGGLQQTDRERHPFGIYGIPDWKTLRESPDETKKGKLHIWRIYDYPHIALLYLSMFKASKQTGIKTALASHEYLRRAWGTAVAMFTIPMEIDEWSAYKTGLYNELCIVEIIDACRELGWTDKADELRGHWEKKVRHFILEEPNLFGSEYPFDSTGFESTYALAAYAMERMDGLEGKAREFLDVQMKANVFCRGWLETAYYLLGSDYRGCGSTMYTLSYMAAMGGWSLLEHALFWSKEPWAMLRLAYASILSSWALMNSGTKESNYGYWYPGKENDGGAGGGFEPSPYGETWLEQPHHRGSWYYSCEIDLGFTGYLRAARTVLAEDPVFGWTCYGGSLTVAREGYEILPADGLNRRFNLIGAKHRLHVEVAGNEIAKIRLSKHFGALDIELKSSSRCRVLLRGSAETVFFNCKETKLKTNGWIQVDLEGQDFSLKLASEIDGGA